MDSPNRVNQKEEEMPQQQQVDRKQAETEIHQQGFTEGEYPRISLSRKRVRLDEETEPSESTTKTASTFMGNVFPNPFTISNSTTFTQPTITPLDSLGYFHNPLPSPSQQFPPFSGMNTNNWKLPSINYFSNNSMLPPINPMQQLPLVALGNQSSQSSVMHQITSIQVTNSPTLQQLSFQQRQPHSTIPQSVPAPSFSDNQQREKIIKLDQQNFHIGTLTSTTTSSTTSSTTTQNSSNTSNTIPSTSPTPREQTNSPTNTNESQDVNNNNDEGLFLLEEQPSSTQRKSYSYENRWASPTPLVLRMRDQIPGQPRPKISNATVEVRLVSDLCEEGAATNDVLQGEGGVLKHSLDKDFKAKFYLKFLKTSNASQWRMLFIIEFNKEGSAAIQTQKIYTNPFVVISNTKKAKSHPKRSE